MKRQVGERSCFPRGRQQAHKFFQKRKTRAALQQRAFPGCSMEESVSGLGCRWRNVRLLGESALALGFADVAHGAVQVGVRTVGRISHHAVDHERGNFSSRVTRLFSSCASAFGDCGLGIEGVLGWRSRGRILGDVAKVQRPGRAASTRHQSSEPC
jgi:hypothetical protein